MAWIAENSETIAAFVGGLITGGGASWALTMRFNEQKAIIGKNAVDQSRARAGGDIVGRDKTSGKSE